MPIASGRSGLEQDVRIPIDRVTLDATLTVPAAPDGIVVFVHGSGSSRHSPRNRAVAVELQRGGLATLLLHLLTPAEERVDVETAHLRFDVEMLAARVGGALAWLARRSDLRHLGIGLFGASTGAAAALIAAARRPEHVGAVVSRGGRPDLAGEYLSSVRSPTLLIVGGADKTVLALNQHAQRQLGGRVSLVVVPGATHLFQEPGALNQVSREARQWFQRHLTNSGTSVEWPRSAARGEDTVDARSLVRKECSSNES